MNATFLPEVNAKTMDLSGICSVDVDFHVRNHDGRPPMQWSLAFSNMMYLSLDEPTLHPPLLEIDAILGDTVHPLAARVADPFLAVMSGNEEASSNDILSELKMERKVLMEEEMEDDSEHYDVLKIDNWLSYVDNNE